MEETADLDAFADAGQVSSYALPAFGWAVSAGIIQGTDKNQLQPGGLATRAQMAAMFARSVRYILR